MAGVHRSAACKTPITSRRLVPVYLSQGPVSDLSASDPDKCAAAAVMQQKGITLKVNSSGFPTGTRPHGIILRKRCQRIDLIIAATALHYGLTVVSRDPSDYKKGARSSHCSVERYGMPFICLSGRFGFIAAAALPYRGGRGGSSSTAKSRNLQASSRAMTPAAACRTAHSNNVISPFASMRRRKWVAGARS
jgi:hypothetical protein